MESSQIYLKLQMLFPHLKKGENQDYNNYRPIQLISNLSKVTEKLVHLRLYSFLVKIFLPFERQCSVCKKLPTNHALIDITIKIQTIIAKDSFICDVYVDFKRAFIYLFVSPI